MSDDSVKTLKETMQRIERLLTRYELDMAGRLHAVDYQATIATLCEQFEVQMRVLTQKQRSATGSSCMSASSATFGLAVSRSKSGERS